MDILKKTPAPTLAGIAIVIFLTVNLFHIGDYSQTVDEPRVIERGRLSWQLIASTLRLSDNPPHQIRAQLDSHTHPPLFGMLNAVISQLAHRIFKLDSIESLHVLPLLWSTAGLIYLFLLSKQLFGPWVGLCSILFMMAFPRFIAHAHYNPKDVPLMMAAVFAVRRFFIALNNKTIFNTIGAGLSLGLVCALGLNGLLLIPILLAGALLSFRLHPPEISLYESHFKYGTGRFLVILMCCAFLSFWIFWPQLWTDPLTAIRSINYFLSDSWYPNNQILWFGAPHSPTTLPWSYIAINVLITTPAPTLLLALVGITMSLFRIEKKNWVVHGVLLSWLLLPIVLRSQEGIVRYNEMRHVFLSIPPLAIYSGVGLTALSIFFKKRWPAGGIFLSISVTAALFLYLIINTVRWHPFQGSYYNEFIQWKYPRHIEDHLLISPWGVTCRPVVEWLNHNAELNSTVCIQCEGDIRPYGLRPDLSAVCDSNTQFFTLTSDMLGWKEYKGFKREQAQYVEQRLNSAIFYVFKRGENGF